MIWKCLGVIVLVFTMGGGVIHDFPGPEENAIYDRNSFHSNQEIIVDNQPVKGNRALFGVCNSTISRQSMSCDLVMKTFDEKTVKTQTCRTKIQGDQDRPILQNQFQLKTLFNTKVIFMWLSQDPDDKSGQQILFYRTINFSNCKYSENKISRKVRDNENSGIDSFHLVTYDGKDPTFGIYYRDDDLCHSKMCGTLHRENGRLLLGPTQSFMPTEYFQGTTYVCPANPGSSLDGHFVFSPQLHLVTNELMIKELMAPRDLMAQVVSIDAGLVGFCYHSLVSFRRVNCFQFDPQGNNVSHHSIDLDYTPGKSLALRNLARGEMLLVTSQCEAEEWCESNYELVPFHVVRLGSSSNNGGRGRKRQRQEPRQFRGVDCNYAHNVRMDVRAVEHSGEDEYGGSGTSACVTFVCYALGEGQDRSYVNVIQKCV